MFYRLSLTALPELKEIYEIGRSTVWRCADRRNILVFITEGACRFEIDGEDIRAAEGDAILIPAGQEYLRHPEGDTLCRFVYLHFTAAEALVPVTAEAAAEEWNREAETANGSGTQKPTHRILFLTQKMNVGDENERLRSLLRRMIAERFSHGALSQTFSSAFLCEFLVSLAETVHLSSRDIPAVDNRFPPPLVKAISLIRKNYNKKLTVDDLCRECNISPQHLIRLFRRHLGTTPLGYINRNKIRHAVEMLRTSELTVKEISYALGFDNPNYFSRLFTKIESLPPSAARARIRNYPEEKPKDNL